MYVKYLLLYVYWETVKHIHHAHTTYLQMDNDVHRHTASNNPDNNQPYRVDCYRGYSLCVYEKEN